MNMREKQARAAKAKIIKTTFKLFDKHGCGNVSIGTICKTAKISSGAFYNYFSSKDQLIVLYIRQYLHEEIETHIAPKIGKGKTRALVLALFDIIFSFEDEKGLEWSYTYYISALSLGKNAYSFERMMPYNTLCSILEKGIERKEVPDTYTPEFLADYLFSIANGTSVGWCLQEGEGDLLSNGNKFIQLAFDSIISK